MPLFECTGCGAVENTALGDYWMRVADRRPVLCSECATGRWHDRFPKRTVAEAGCVTGRDGFLHAPEGARRPRPAAWTDGRPIAGLPSRRRAKDSREGWRALRR